MSWDKNTIMFSDITPIIRTLINCDEKYFLGTLGSVKGLGNNDCWNGIDDYDLRILIYKGGVILEQMRRTCDCDGDDVIVSEVFNFDEMPDKWALERNVDYYDYFECKEFQNYISLDKFKSYINEFVK